MPGATAVWRGASGTPYHYWVYQLPASIGAAQSGNYVYARMFYGRWIPVYIGQGDIGEKLDTHPRADCIKAKRATHYHAHKNPNERDRLAEVKDLLAAYPLAYAPEGCNLRQGQ